MLHKNLRLNFKNVDSFVNFISKKFENENFTEMDSDDDYILFRYEGNDIDYYQKKILTHTKIGNISQMIIQEQFLI